MSSSDQLPKPQLMAAHHPPLIGGPAPSFTARTTMGEVSLADYRGSWLVFFAHPADFTPVCTSEFIGFAKAYAEFRKLGCDLVALSVDSLFAHIAWVRNIAEKFGVEVPFPIIEDPSMAIAQAYGMIHPGAMTSATVRATFVIDPDGMIRAISWYPMSTGRSVAEILRLVRALQVSDLARVSTPEGWMPGDKVIDSPPLGDRPLAEVSRREGSIDWYYRLREP
jgi:peroxiredoxin (alkyl hydroperoxide reductase subunit C)